MLLHLLEATSVACLAAFLPSSKPAMLGHVLLRVHLSGSLPPGRALCFQGLMGLDWAQPNNPTSSHRKVFHLNHICRVPLPREVTRSQVTKIRTWASLGCSDSLACAVRSCPLPQLPEPAAKTRTSCTCLERWTSTPTPNQWRCLRAPWNLRLISRKHSLLSGKQVLRSGPGAGVQSQ